MPPDFLSVGALVGQVKSHFVFLPGRILKPAVDPAFIRLCSSSVKFISVVLSGKVFPINRRSRSALISPYHMDNPGFRRVKQNQIAGLIDVITQVIGQGNKTLVHTQIISKRFLQTNFQIVHPYLVNCNPHDSDINLVF